MDILKDILNDKNINNDFKKGLKLNKYKEAYNILMEYWDSFPDEEKPIIHKRLEGLGL